MHLPEAQHPLPGHWQMAPVPQQAFGGWRQASVAGQQQVSLQQQPASAVHLPVEQHPLLGHLHAALSLQHGWTGSWRHLPSGGQAQTSVQQESGLVHLPEAQQPSPPQRHLAPFLQQSFWVACMVESVYLGRVINFITKLCQSPPFKGSVAAQIKPSVTR